jgi:hypothetical protein
LRPDTLPFLCFVSEADLMAHFFVPKQAATPVSNAQTAPIYIAKSDQGEAPRMARQAVTGI